MILKGLCATSLLALAAACSTPVVDRLDNAQPSGSAFNNRLTREYKLLAKFEADDMQDFIDAGELNKIERVAADLRSRKDGYAIIATGHTDRAGGYDYNKELSVERAVTVKDALIERGVEPDVIVINGKGEMDPAKPTGDGVPEHDNRRVMVSVR